MPTLRGVILDVDGTLVDSNESHARAWVEAMGEDGIEVSLDKVRSLIGKGGDRLLAETCGLDRDSARGKAINARRKAIFTARYLPGLRPFPSVRPLLERMRGDGLTLVVASSAERAELTPLLKVAGVDDLMHEETSSSDAKRSKPSPDIVQAALKRSGLTPETAVMVGDTPYDIEAAGKAGVKTIAVRSGGWGDADLAGALVIYDDAADFLVHYETSPLGRKAVAR